MQLLVHHNHLHALLQKELSDAHLLGYSNKFSVILIMTIQHDNEEYTKMYIVTISSSRCVIIIYVICCIYHGYTSFWRINSILDVSLYSTECRNFGLIEVINFQVLN